MYSFFPAGDLALTILTLETTICIPTGWPVCKRERHRTDPMVIHSHLGSSNDYE